MMRTRPQLDTYTTPRPSERQQLVSLLRFLGIILFCVLAAALVMTLVLTLTS